MIVRVVTAILLLALIGSAPHRGWRLVYLQFHLISIEIPTAYDLVPTTGFEHADFTIRKEGRVAMHIAGAPGMAPDLVDLPGAKRYCVNGIYGVALVKDGNRSVLLRLPPEGQQLQYYFEFKEHDSTAKAIMNTFRIRGLTRHCVSNYN
jgi:hypothetical protein